VLVLALSAFVQLTGLSKTVVEYPLSADAGDYFSYAWNLRHHHVYSRAPSWRTHEAPSPDKVRSPGYPLLLQLAGAPEANESWALRFGLLQAALGVGIVGLSYLVARQMLARALALAVALLVATNPFIANSAVYLLTETPFAFFLLASLLLSLRALRDRAHWGWAVAAGLCWGACSLVRPTAQFLPPLLLLGTLLLPAWRRWRRSAAIGTLAFVLAMAPWVVRNQRIPPGPPGENLMVNSIVHGSYPGFMYEDDPRTRGFPYRFDPQVTAIQRDLGSALGHIARKAVAQPQRYAAWYLFGKPYYFLSLEDVQSFDIQIYSLASSPWYDRAEFAAVAAASRALHWPMTMAALAALGLLAFRARWLRLAEPQRVAASLVAVVLGYAIAVHMAAAPFPRYGIPFRPLVYMLALLAAHAAWRNFRERAR
jgi:4-amino-4-deoxy-L-arabinose transferase-like glycosyltransferase